MQVFMVTGLFACQHNTKLHGTITGVISIRCETAHIFIQHKYANSLTKTCMPCAISYWFWFCLNETKAALSFIWTCTYFSTCFALPHKSVLGCVQKKKLNFEIQT